MSLRTKLSLQTTLIVGCTLGVVLSGTYLLFGRYTQDLYYKKLQDRALTAAFFYLEKDELNSLKYQVIEKRFWQNRYESIRLYQMPEGKVYIDDSLHYTLPAATLSRIRKAGSHQFLTGGRQFYGLFYPDNQGDFIIIASGINYSGQEQLKALRWMLLSFFLLGFGLNYFFTRWLAYQTFQPFSKLIQKVNSITTENLHTRLSVPKGRSNDELQQLIVTFNYLLERLETDVNGQRNFLKNVSHELRTPLTAIIGDIEVTLKKERKTEEYTGKLTLLKKDALHLHSIIEGLLALSGLEASRTRKMQPLRIDEVLWNVLEKKKIEYPDVEIVIDFSNMDQGGELLTQNGHKELLFIAISNLLDNAIKFSGAKPVKILIEEKNHCLAVHISDHGPGIPEWEKEKIFDLFYRGQHTRQIQGHGVGLYLTRNILDLHHITLNVLSQNGEGTVISLLFPNAQASHIK